MNSGKQIKVTGSGSAASGNGPARIVSAPPWTIYEFEEVGSTNLIAAGLEPWHAVVAVTQNAGRGRYERRWVSDKGGLWLSAVVPMRSPGSGRLLPLIAGMAVFELVRGYGISSVRMRWPNDILVGDRKLAGILLDSFSPGKAVIGIGINVSNAPEQVDKTLTFQTTRLSDLLDETPGHDQLCRSLLAKLRQGLDAFASAGEAISGARLNELWGEPRGVELNLNGISERGLFMGVDDDGSLLLRRHDGTTATFAAHQVRHLTEIES